MQGSPKSHTTGEGGTDAGDKCTPCEIKYVHVSRRRVNSKRLKVAVPWTVWQTRSRGLRREDAGPFQLQAFKPPHVEQLRNR